MAIPLISNIGFTEVDSAGTLNDKAGVAKSKLPIQFFKLTGNISGNLTLNNDSAHKKIILDTNGNTILNSSGSPLTTNSSTTLELIGSGNIQSTLKTSTVTNTSTGHTGTTNFSNSNSSTIVVSNVNTDTSVVKYVERNLSAQSGSNQSINIRGSQVDAGTTVSGGSTPNASTIFGQGGDYFSSNGGTAIFMGDTSSSSGSPESYNYRLVLSGFGPNTVSALSMHEGANIDPGSYPNLGFGGVIGAHNRYAGVVNQVRHTFIYSGGASHTNRRFWFKFERDGNDRSLVFTNNLSISCVLSGADPFDGVTVSAGATATSTRTNSTDGSHDITMTISGSDGSSQPFALADVNSGTGSLDTSAYSGTFSTKAFS